MSKVLSALPWLLSESTEARLYGVASRITDTEAEVSPGQAPTPGTPDDNTYFEGLSVPLPSIHQE